MQRDIRKSFPAGKVTGERIESQKKKGKLSALWRPLQGATKYARHRICYLNGTRLKHIGGENDGKRSEGI